MPNLGDYLGQLLSEITLARLHADLETVRLAELYAAHPLLRAMPVPHVRLPDIEIEVPVVIKAVEEPRAGESVRGGVALPKLRTAFDKILETHLASIGVVPTAEVKKKLATALDDRTARLGQPAEIAVDVHRVADDLSAVAMKVVGEGLPAGGERASAVALRTSELQQAVRLQFLKERTAPPRLLALVTTAELREAGPAENLTRLRLKISEQGLEWTSVESEGIKQDRLVPE